MLMTILKKDTLDLFVQMLEKKMHNAIQTIFLVINSRVGQKSQDPFSLIYSKMTGINLCAGGQSLFMKVPFLLRFVKTIHYKRKIMSKSYTHSWCDSEKQYKSGLV